MKKTIMLMITILCLSSAVYAAPDSLVPVGAAVGIHLDGELVVVGFDEEIGAQASSAGVRTGDRIVSVNGAAPTSLDCLRSAADASDVRLCVDRDGKKIEFYLTPVATAEGRRLGLRVRDGVTGIGTVTFYDPETGDFGALGHSVNDPETGECIPITGGTVMRASVTDVVVGKSGHPGELRGSFDRADTIGEIAQNGRSGIFGTLHIPVEVRAPLPVAEVSQVHTGKATILSNVSGTEVRPYEIEITKLDASGPCGRNFLFEVRDSDLIARTGGIVQGMSGSPVIQDGKFVGAVTHVLVDNPRMGYGIFIENMLDADNAA